MKSKKVKNLRFTPVLKNVTFVFHNEHLKHLIGNVGPREIDNFLKLNYKLSIFKLTFKSLSLLSTNKVGVSPPPMERLLVAHLIQA